MKNKLKIHPAASIFVFSKENPPRTLLVKHKKLNAWLQPGGHQENWENPIEAALRETKEETGLDLSKYFSKPIWLDQNVYKLPAPVYLLVEKIPRYRNKPEHLHQDMIYVLQVSLQKIKLNKKESDDVGWFDKNEIKKLKMLKNARILLLEAFGSLDRIDKP